MTAWANRGEVPLTSVEWSRDFQSSGQTRREFCERHHIPVTTFDYWRRAQSRRARLVEVQVAASEPSTSFIVCLDNGRRIESSWKFADAELIRLIRIAERLEMSPYDLTKGRITFRHK